MIKKIFLFIILTVFSVSLIGCSEKNSKMENRETNENQVVI